MQGLIKSFALPAMAAGQLSKDDAAHLSSCKVRTCRRCAYLRNAAEWQRQTLISNSDVSYLRSETTPEGQWRVFCWVCRKAHGADKKGLAAGVGTLLTSTM